MINELLFSPSWYVCVEGSSCYIFWRVLWLCIWEIMLRLKSKSTRWLRHLKAEIQVVFSTKVKGLHSKGVTFDGKGVTCG